jgi:DNA polymerase III subunit delta
MPATGSRSAAPLVLICGDDEFTVKQRAASLYRQWCAELGGMDHETIDAAVNNSHEALKVLARLREAINTLPFFGGAKAVWFQNCNFLGDERAATQEVTGSLADLAQELKQFDWRTIRLLLSAGKVDKRKVFFKTLEKAGQVEVFSALSLDDKAWVAKAEDHVLLILKECQKQITDEALAEMISRVGPNLRQLHSEAEKLAVYVGQRGEITLEDVNAVCVRNKQARAFALGDALGDRDLPRLLKRLDEEFWGLQFDKDKSEIGLLYGLISKVRAMIFIKEMLREGWLKPESDYYRFKSQLERVPTGQWPEDKRFNPLSINAFVLFKAASQAQNYSPAELIHAMELLLECNHRLVSTKQDEKMVLQQTLVAIVGDKRQPAGRK